MAANVRATAEERESALSKHSPLMLVLGYHLGLRVNKPAWNFDRDGIF
jgi:hypothetical protein